MENLGFEKVYITVACTVTNVILLRNDCFDENQHQNLPVEYLLDYEGMRQNNDHLYKIMHSQIYTSMPFSTKPLNFIDIIYFYISRRFMSFLKIRKLQNDLEK